jgi:uncharacterized glyoxalase superfamily protein PhnB
MLRNRSMPESQVIPEIAYPDVGSAVEWLCAAFGFTVRVRIGNHRAQLNVGEGAIVVREADTDPPPPSSVMIRVEDADRHCAQARAHGVRILKEPADYPYGERQYSSIDFAGHRWHFSQSIADVDPADWGGMAGQV